MKSHHIRMSKLKDISVLAADVENKPTPSVQSELRIKCSKKKF